MLNRWVAFLWDEIVSSCRALIASCMRSSRLSSEAVVGANMSPDSVQGAEPTLPQVAWKKGLGNGGGWSGQAG